MRILLITGLLAAAGLVVWWLAPWSDAPAPVSSSAPEIVPVHSLDMTEPEPEPPRIAYPLDPPTPIAADETPPEPKPEPEPLPDLDNSDVAMERALVAVLGTSFDEAPWRLRGFVRRVVVSVDNLLQPQVPQRFIPLSGPEDSATVERRDERIWLSADNYERYDHYVRLVEAVDPALLVSVYQRYYPLFQEAYEELGYPDAYFNDRLVEVIDSLLAAPEAEGPIELVQPSVIYRFADPDLEALPAGQKLMIRMGPDNAVVVKAALREFREALLDRVTPE